MNEVLSRVVQTTKAKAGHIHYFDHSSHYATHGYKAFVKGSQMIGCMSRKGNCCINSYTAVSSGLAVAAVPPNSNRFTSPTINKYDIAPTSPTTPT
ncbi:MAG: hypothetical protein H6Q68_123 [Firmicutes bacterium]|nr:hypothetical protein [Bacillota bacterium]